MAMNLNLFSTPLSHQAGKYPALANRVTDLILNYQKDEHRNPNSPQTMHDGLFESRFDFLKWEMPVVQELKETLLNDLFYFLLQVSGLTKEQLQGIRFDYESWFHVANNGAYFQPHTHPNHAWSMVFCASAGDFQPENAHESGKLLFLDPRLGAAMYLDQSNKEMHRPYSFNGFKVTLEPGSVVIFPSYLQHAVEPYRGSKPRITVATNFRFF